MKAKSSSLRFRIIAFALTAGIIAFAFIHSSMPADQSSVESGGVLEFIRKLFDLFGIKINLTDQIIRKTAHFIEYSSLGVTLTLCAYSFNRKKPYIYSPHILTVGLLTTLIDETIQLNVPGRSGQITDIWLDLSGMVFGAVIMMIILVLFVKIRKLK